MSVEPQELTDEQKAQARANIDRYVWHTEYYYGNKIQYCECPSEATFNIEIAKTVAAPGLDGVNALLDMIACIETLVASAYRSKFNDSAKEWVINDIGYVTEDFNALKASGACTKSSGGSINIGVDETLVATYGIFESAQTVDGVGCTHYIVASLRNIYSNQKYVGLFYYNINTKEYVNKIRIFNGDYTLSSLGFYADAKAVGDALALKIDKSDIATDEEIIEMLIVEDMFPAVTDTDGSLLADENGNILLW